MGRPKNPTELGDIIEKGIKDLIKSAETWDQRLQSLQLGTRHWTATKKIEMPDEGSGFSEDEKGETE